MLLTVNKVNSKVISGVVGGDKYSLEYNVEVYDKLLALESKFDSATTLEDAKAAVEEAKAIISGVDTEAKLKGIGEFLKHDEKADKYYLHSNGVTSSIALPKVLVDRIIEAIEKELPYEPMIKAWMWFLKNPDFSISKAQYFAKYITTTYVDKAMKADLIKEGYTEEKAVEMATFNDVAITKNGLLSTYKYATIKYRKYDKEGQLIDRYEAEYDEETGEKKVKLPENAEDYYLIPPIMGESGDAFFAGADLGHRIVVGQIHSLPTDALRNKKDGTVGGGGLHLGGLKYIESYGGSDRLLLNCFANPMHIFGFTDGGDGAIRTNEYMVHSACFAPSKSFYNESSYLEHSKEQWANMRAEAIKDSEEKIKALKATQEELNAL